MREKVCMGCKWCVQRNDVMMFGLPSTNDLYIYVCDGSHRRTKLSSSIMHFHFICVWLVRVGGNLFESLLAELHATNVCGEWVRVRYALFCARRFTQNGSLVRVARSAFCCRVVSSSCVIRIRIVNVVLTTANWVVRSLGVFPLKNMLFQITCEYILLPS